MAGVSAQTMDLGNAAIIGKPSRPPNVCAPEIMFKVVASESSVASATCASDSSVFYFIQYADIFYSERIITRQLLNMGKLCGEMPLEWQKHLPGLDSALSPATRDAEWRERVGRRMDKYVEGLGDLMKWMLKLYPATRCRGDAAASMV
ncbi:hypothetical protein BT96DRAFT_294794 [Gymnopus androsaceus JB14]|uniref:Uncharacterized protein n=1 Tax=Gymnopus androsaceus JB14 TaxID=1447944 RepID=A0A6A4IA93_9AGAR|nr:hypothetical protein BT96DRAFT_294794 [Gymnopus androsaceus JB14]